MKISKEEILQAIAEMNVMDVCELVKMMESKFGISAQAVAGPQNTVAEKDEEKPEEKSEFNVVLTGAGSNKIGAIKAVRSVTELSLKDAKSAVENVPFTVRSAVSKDEAEELKAKIEASGAEVQLT